VTPTPARTPRSVWLRPERPARDRQLSRAAIVTAAVAILDAEGIQGLSMRRVAARLEVTAGSLYWYVGGKDELLELAADHVLGEIDLPEAGGGAGWREVLARAAASQRAMMLRHPWAASVLAAVPNMGPNALRAADRILAVLAAAGFGPGLADAALAAISNLVTGAVLAETAWRRAAAGPAATLADWQREAAGYLAQITGRYPHVAARLTAPPPDIEASSQARFALALDCLLDGLQARLDS
jgi:AcrR family transcriptional regulator